MPGSDVPQSLHFGPLVVFATRFDFKTPPGVRVEADLCDRVLYEWRPTRVQRLSVMIGN